MASGRAADRDDPKKSKRRAARSLDRDPISELHQGQRSDVPHQRAGHMTAPDHFAEAELNILRRRGPSTYDLCSSLPLANHRQTASSLEICSVSRASLGRPSGTHSRRRISEFPIRPLAHNFTTTWQHPFAHPAQFKINLQLDLAEMFGEGHSIVSGEAFLYA